MLTEKTIRQRIDSILETDLHPVRRTKLLLRMSYQAKAVAHLMMKLGFTAHHKRDIDRTKRFWSAAANFFSIADEVRDLAGQALKGRGPKLGFGYGARQYAYPSWDRTAVVAPPAFKESE